MALQVGELFAQLTMDSAPFDKEMGGLKNKIGGLGGAITKGLAGVAVGAVAALGGAMVGGIKLTGDYQKAMNGLEAATGATEAEMSSMGDAMKGIYSRNFGDSFQDVADTMAFAAQNTTALGEELEYLTQDALMMRDTFDMEVTESLRGADAMMTQLGTTGTESMSMIAEATQKGLNRNEDLIDTIEEYSVYYAEAGLSAQDMFAQFENASAAGVRNLDLVGDSMKEFSIIMKEDGDKASDALTALGLPAQQLRNDFAGGGEKAKEAFQTIVAELGKIEDPLDRNAIGVELFGTKFEDLEADAILAMGNLQGTITGTVDTLDKINAIKYNSFGEAMAGIGRQLQVGLLMPIGELLLPLLNKFANWMATKIPAIIAFFESMGTKAMAVFAAFSPYIEQAKAAFDTLAAKVVEVFNRFMPKFSEAQGMASQYVEYLKSGFSQMWAVVGPLIQLVGDKVMEVFGIIISWWNANGSQLLANVQIVFQGIWAAIQFVMPLIMAIVNMVFNNIKGVITGALNIISGAFNIFAGLFTGNWSKMWEGVKQLVGGAIQFIWNLWQLMLYGRIISGIKLLGTKALGLFKNMWSSIQNGFATFTNWITSLVTRFVGWIVKGFTGLVTRSVNQFNMLRTFGASIFNSIREVIRNIIVNLVSTVTTRITFLKDKAIGIFNNLLGRVRTIWNNIKEAITKPIQKAKDTVSGIVDSIKRVFNNMKLSFPKVKMPKFSIGTKKNALFGFDVPTFNVDWFKTGGIATGPAIAGVGEAGSEAIVPLAGRRMQPFSDAVGQQVAELLGKNGGGGGDIHITLSVDGKEIAKATRKHSDELNRRQENRDTRAGGYNID